MRPFGSFSFFLAARAEVAPFEFHERRAMLTLVTGPVRSGKTRFALELARESGCETIYVATLRLDRSDAEMVERVEQHRRERGAMPSIETNEANGPTLASVIAAARANDVLVVDSLGTWLGAQLVDAADAAAAEAMLLDALTQARAQIVIVAEETGWSVVPATPLGRAFRDRLGRLTATLAGQASRAYLVVAGFAIDLRATGRRVTG